ncbi:MAG: hypothetical protein ACREEM_10940 [Blastocatellia bacterium]
MNFIKHILSSLISAACGGARRRRRLAVCVLSVAAAAAGLTYFQPHRAQAQQTPTTLHGAAALEQLKQNGQYESLQAAMDSAQDQRIYRPGLRNSFAEHPLSATELDAALTELRHKTGFVRMRFDEAGFLTIDDRSEISGGSAAARELLLAAVDGKKSINLQSHNRSPEVIFARLSEGVKYIGWPSDVQIVAAPIEIDFDDFNHLRGDRKAVEAFDPGFVILHELCHAVLELRDPSAGVNAAGDCESYVNRIRRELGMPERQQYAATPYRRTNTLTGPIVGIAELIFAQTEPGREPEKPAKTKTLYLKWNVRQVGIVEEKTRAGVVAP